MPDPREMYDDHVVAIHAFIARRIGLGPAADVVSDVFRIAIERRATFDPKRGAMRSWLYGIAANVLRQHWRTETRRLRAIGRLEVATIAVDDVDAVVERLDAIDDAERAMVAITQMDATDRDILTLLVWEGCSYAEIAEALELPIGTVRSRLHRARANLALVLSRNATPGSTKSSEVRHDG